MCFRSLLLVVAWVMKKDFLTQPGTVYMGINLGGRNAFVSQHGLNHTQVCSAFEEMCGKRVAECVWRHVFADAGFCTQVFYEMKNHDSTDIFYLSSYSDKHVVLIFGGNAPLVAIKEI